MRINGKEPRVIFALNLPTELDDVRAIHAAGIEHFVVGEGCYKGKHERSYNVSINDASKVRALAKAHGQESILFLDNQYNAWLSFSSGEYPSFTATPGEHLKYIGEFKETSVTQAARADAWSKFHGIYYVAR